jgi:hypothetical protein
VLGVDGRGETLRLTPRAFRRAVTDEEVAIVRFLGVPHEDPIPLIWHDIGMDLDHFPLSARYYFI